MLLLLFLLKMLLCLNLYLGIYIQVLLLIIRFQTILLLFSFPVHMNNAAVEKKYICEIPGERCSLNYLLCFYLYGGLEIQVKEIYNFAQGDLTTEDVLILDCHDELYLWIGCHSNVTSKGQALTLGQVLKLN